jgi:hypothetical protein
MDILKSCDNCKNNTYMPNTGPCRECWKFCNWAKKPGDSNKYHWPWLPEPKTEPAETKQ